MRSRARRHCESDAEPSDAPAPVDARASPATSPRAPPRADAMARRAAGFPVIRLWAATCHLRKRISPARGRSLRHAARPRAARGEYSARSRPTRQCAGGDVVADTLGGTAEERELPVV